MANIIKIKRGLSSNISNATLEQGELAIMTDTQDLYVGTDSGNKKVGGGPKNILDGNAIGSVRTSGSREESDSYKLGQNAFAEGDNTKASGSNSHAEGDSTIASGLASHAEGSGKALGDYSHAEGASREASGRASHAEGYSTIASGQTSHAEGNQTTASGDYSHAEGDNATASGLVSHAEGSGTTAKGNNQHVQGKFNIADTTSAHIVGNGSRYSNRSNAHTIDWNGNAWFAGDVYTGSTSGTNKDDGSKKLATEEYVTNLLRINNAGFHNSIFRGKDITSYLTDGSLYTRISNGTFEDLFVGDYIIKNNITWRIAGFDLYLHKGDIELTQHHAIIVPDKRLTDCRMKASDTTVNGYRNSSGCDYTMTEVLNTYITPVFGNHVIEIRNLLTRGINETGYNRYGTNSGCSNEVRWYSRKVDLMNEVQVFGSIIWSSSGYDIGSDNCQLPLFRLAPEFIADRSYENLHQDENPELTWYWLRDIASASSYAGVDTYGNSSGYPASKAAGVRPYFYID